MDQPAFIPGRELSRLFYEEAVKPILDETFPDLRYSAALLGTGSEVLGFDDKMSTDHHWGPRLQLFLDEEDLGIYGPILRPTLAHQLPTSFHGFPTNFSPPDLNDNGTQLMVAIDEGPVNHRVETTTLDTFCQDYLGIGLEDYLNPADWLTIPGQKLRSIASGAIYRDDNGQLGRLQQRLAYYPRDIWLAMLAAGWTRVGQEEHFMGRAGHVGDEVGSRLIVGRLVRDLMNLCFLMERQYAPYIKWFGSAFTSLDCATKLSPIFEAALSSDHWQARERHLVAAYEELARMHNALGITEPLLEQATPFFGRPFLVIHAERFAAAIKEQIAHPEVARIVSDSDIGAVEQFSDSTDVLSNATICRRMQVVYN